MIPRFLGDPENLDESCSGDWTGRPRSFVVTFEPDVEFSSEPDKQFHGREMIPIKKFLQSFNIDTVQDILSMKIEAHLDVLCHTSSSPPTSPLQVSSPSKYGKKARAFFRDIHDSFPHVMSKTNGDEKKKALKENGCKKIEVIQKLRIEPLASFSGRVRSPVFDTRGCDSSSDIKYFLEVERQSLEEDGVTCSVMRIRSPSSSTTDSTAEDPMSSHYTE
jgi:hypothetical protein